MVILTAVISQMSPKRLDVKAHLVISRSFDAKTVKNASPNTKNATTEKNAQMARTKKIAVSIILLKLTFNQAKWSFQ